MYNWSIVEEASENELSVICNGVIEFGRSLATKGNAKPIACLVRDDRRIVAGASGRTEYNRLFINYLWVTEELRSSGIGSQIIEKIEKAATDRGCSDSLIETLNDRIALLYARLGYQTITKVTNFVGPFTRHTMVKQLGNGPHA